MQRGPIDHFRLILCATAILMAGCGNPAPTEQDLWAEALLIVQATHPPPGKSADELFLRAVHAAPPGQRADIFVTWGDKLGGPAGFGEMLASLAGNAATRATEAIEDELADVSTLSPDKREAGVEQIAGRYAAAIQRELPVLAGELADWFSGMEAASLGMYEAALADDPDHRIAWYRIAMDSNSDESLSRLALLRLRQLDPDNAMPWYVEAGRFGTNRLEEALEALEEGNRKPWWKYPEPDYPADFNLRFPDLEPYTEAGVAGESVPAWVIKSYGDANTMESIRWSSRKTGLVAGLSECGDQLIQAGETEKGMRCLIAARELCLKIAGNRNLDTMWGISGLSIIRAPDGILTELPPGTLSNERETILRRTAAVGSDFRARLNALLSEAPPLEGLDFYRNLDAIRAFEGRQRGLMEELLEDPQFRRCSFLPEL